MDEIKNKLIEAKNNGIFLRAVSGLLLRDLGNKHAIVEEIIKLHNGKLIDIFSELISFTKDPEVILDKYN